MAITELELDDLEQAPPIVQVPETPEISADQTHEHDSLPHKLAALAITGLLFVGVGLNPQRTEDYVQLAKANIEHTVSGEPNPRSFDYLQRYEVDNGLFTDNIQGNYAQVWGHSQALSALNLISEIPGSDGKARQDFLHSLSASNHYWGTSEESSQPGYNSSINESNFGEKERFVDDNLWMGLIHIREYEKSGNPMQLERAKQIFDMAMQQWDTARGGIYWQVQWRGVEVKIRAMVSNAPAVQLGAKLYELTGNRDYLPQIEEIYTWMQKHKDKDLGIYNDHTREDDTVDNNKYSYVQGVAIGATLSMSQVLPEKYSIEEAVDQANITLDSFDQGLIQRNHVFDSICIQNLLDLSKAYGNPAFTQRVLSFLHTTAENLPPYSEAEDLLDMSGMMQIAALEQTYHS